MPYALQIKYFNSFWLKKVNGNVDLDPSNTNTGSSTVTTSVNATTSETATDPAYYLPTWPSLPWATDLYRKNPNDNTIYQVPPIFPWGGRSGLTLSMGNWNTVAAIGLGKGSELNTSPNPEVGRERNWFVEEARIDGGYNNTSVDFGVKAFFVEDNNNQEHRFNSLIHSGVYNSRTGINETNVFSTALPITRSLDPVNNSIQKLYASDTNLIVFQENKVSRGLIDKDIIYTAEGGSQTLPPGIVLGQITPYLGNYGISKNPESFGTFGNSRYFADVNRNAIMRLAENGLTEISKYGMIDFFRDELSNVNNGFVQRLYSMSLYQAKDYDSNINQINLSNKNISLGINIDLNELRPGMLLQINGQSLQDVYIASLRDMNGQSPAATVYLSRSVSGEEYGLTSGTYSAVNFIGFVKDKVLGVYDNRNNNYVLSIQKNQSQSGGRGVDSVVFKTLNFDETVKGWVSFFNYMPTDMLSLQNKFFTVKNGDLYRHYDETTSDNRGSFYGVKYPATVQFIFNDNPQISKNFQTINYEGNSGWEVTSILSDSSGQVRYSSNDPWFTTRDFTNAVYSYVEGAYTDTITGQTGYAGFVKKENKYYANLINNSTASPNEIIFGDSMSGIKGFFTTVTMSTDSVTNPGGEKQLFSAGSKYVVSSY